MPRGVVAGWVLACDHELIGSRSFRSLRPSTAIEMRELRKNQRGIICKRNSRIDCIFVVSGVTFVVIDIDSDRFCRNHGRVIRDSGNSGQKRFNAGRLRSDGDIICNIAEVK